MSETGKPTAADIRRLTNHVKGLHALHDEVIEAMQNVQNALLFTTHPELTALDGELDNCYPDARDDG